MAILKLLRVHTDINGEAENEVHLMVLKITMHNNDISSLIEHKVAISQWLEYATCNLEFFTA